MGRKPNPKQDNVEMHKQVFGDLQEASRQPVVSKGYRLNNTINCVTGDTKVLTKQGQKEIESLVGKEVDVWNGEEWSSVTPFKTDRKRIYEVEFSNGLSLRCTDDHRFMVLSPARDSKSIFANKTLEVYTKDLRVGDCLPKFPTETTGTTKELENAYTAGFFCGDGSINNSREGKYPRKELRLYGEKMKLKDKITWKSKNTWGGDDVVRGYLPDNILEKFQVPHEYSTESKTKWLCGLIDADGSSSSSGVNITMKDYSFARDVALLVQSLGGEPFVGKIKRTGGYSSRNDVYYSVNISLFSCGKIFQEIKPHRVKVSAPWPCTNFGKGHFVEVLSVTDTGEDMDTFCFTEEKKGRGVFDGILTYQCATTPTSNSTVGF